MKHYNRYSILRYAFTLGVHDRKESGIPHIALEKGDSRICEAYVRGYNYEKKEN